MERPILFSTPMVKAILDGSKTVTRRIVTERNSSCTVKLSELDFNDIVWDGLNSDNEYIKVAKPEDETRHRVYCKIQSGDILWVRESWATNGLDYFRYRADYSHDGEGINHKTTGFKKPYSSWKPSIHLPKKACRLFLEVISVKTQKIHSMNYADCIKEGLKEGIRHNADLAFKQLWIDINGESSWNENPPVWVIEFKRIDTIK